jgi:hypothetical protein
MLSGAAGVQKAWRGGRPHKAGYHMSFRAAALASAALVAASFLLAPAALASTPKVTQLDGNQLESALLPATAFGPDYAAGYSLNTGKSLWKFRATENISTTSCGNFEDGLGLGLFGETAAALSYSNNPNPWPAYPNTEFYYYQSVEQFPSAKAAASYFSQARAKYAKCMDFTESAPATSDPSSGGFETVTQAVTKTSVGKYESFAVAQSADLSQYPGDPILLNTLVTVEGTDVFGMLSVGGTNDAIPASLMQELIGRVQKLR